MDTSKLLELPDDIKHLFENLLVDNSIFDERLINAASLVDPPEYMDACKVCSTPEGEHSENCIFEVIGNLIHK